MNTILACQLTLLLLNADTASVDFFEAKVRPVFIEHCEKCHGSSKQQEGISPTEAPSLALGYQRYPYWT
jgi:mono/diheme cytochrome c family protein